MRNVKGKILISIMMVLVMLVCTGNHANAAKPTPTTTVTNAMSTQDDTTISGKGMKDIIKAHQDFEDTGKLDPDVADKTSVEAFLSNLIGLGQVLVIIGGATLLIVGGIMAIKWITATPDKQAKLKTQSIGLVLAAIIIFGAVGIWNFVRGIMEEVNKEIEKTEIVYNINA